MANVRASKIVALFTVLAVTSPPIANAAQSPTSCTVTIEATVPPTTTATAYLTGNHPALGPWKPDARAMTGTGPTRQTTLETKRGDVLEFKLTLGSWDREGVGNSGTVLPNFRHEVTETTTVRVTVVDFKKDTEEYLNDPIGSGVDGTLIHWRNVTSKHLERPRNVTIYLPPGYETTTTAYRVIVAHDGQNLFDPRMANTGTDWGVDEAMMRGVRAGHMVPAIVVGVWNTDLRRREYSPWDLGPAYAKFLIDELLPRVRREFRTLPGPPSYTSTMGSSMGGLISFYLVWKHHDTFHSAACLSTHFIWNGAPTIDAAPPLISDAVEYRAPFPDGVRLYFDYGTKGIDALYEPMQKRVDAWMESAGLVRGRDFVTVKCEGADHNEAAWRARLDAPLEFLLRKPKFSGE